MPQTPSVEKNCEPAWVQVCLQTKKYKRSILPMWIIRAWQHISPVRTMKGCRKLCISRAVDGTDNDTLWNYSEEDRNVRSECEEDKGTNCE